MQIASHANVHTSSDSPTLEKEYESEIGHCRPTLAADLHKSRSRNSLQLNSQKAPNIWTVEWTVGLWQAVVKWHNGDTLCENMRVKQSWGKRR